MPKYKVTFLPEELEISIQEGTTLMKAAVEAGIQLEGPCGGKGTCGKCRVFLAEDTERPVLACKTPIKANMTVIIPQREEALFRKGETDIADLGVEIDPGMWKKALRVDEPELKNQYSDLTRLYNALGWESPISYAALKSLPAALRARGHEVTVMYTDQQIVSVEAGNTESDFFGIAVDIGTTTVVAALMNLINGNVLGITSSTNSQNIFGADVISRIEHVINSPQGLAQLQERVVGVLNRMIGELCAKANIQADNIYKVTIAGNTTMEHLFLGIDPRYLAPAPFIPVIEHPVNLEAREIGLEVYPHAGIHLIPNIAGYVGGDTTSVILATQVYNKQGNYLVVDIGTNGEIVLAIDGKMLACSTAAGPALEGAHIKFGMRAMPGAIEGVAFDGKISLKVIGDATPIGICGSGLLQAAQVLRNIGVISPSGKMISREEAEKTGLDSSIFDRLGKDENGIFFLLSLSEDKREAVRIYQLDIRELQLAKGAIRTGIEILMKEAGITAEDIDQVLLAGAFGNYLDKESALGIGLLPKVSPERIISVGNAAGTGARIALISEPLLKKTYDISKEVRHIELSVCSDFHEMFIEYMGFDEV